MRKSRFSEERIITILKEAGLTTTPSGGAGLAALLVTQQRHNVLAFNRGSCVLSFVTEKCWT